MSLHEEQKKKKEIKIFKLFLEICPYQIVKKSVTSKNPPEADILCRTTTDEMIAFELVECVQENIAKSFTDSKNLKKIFHDKLNELPLEQKKQYEINFHNALISIDFSENSTVNQKKSAIFKIFDFLLTLKKNAEGEYSFASSLNLKDIVKWIYISREKFNGPICDIINSGTFNDPSQNRIKDKFQKKYETNSKIELLAYYEIQPEISEDIWKPKLKELKEFIQYNIENSLFKRVWLFSVPQNKILYDYPSADC